MCCRDGLGDPVVQQQLEQVNIACISASVQCISARVPGYTGGWVYDITNGSTRCCYGDAGCSDVIGCCRSADVARVHH